MQGGAGARLDVEPSTRTCGRRTARPRRLLRTSSWVAGIGRVVTAVAPALEDNGYRRGCGFGCKRSRCVGGRGDQRHATTNQIGRERLAALNLRLSVRNREQPPSCK